MTAELVLLGKELLREGRSERFIAGRLGVSRHTMRIHCKEGYREWYEKYHGKDWRPAKEKVNQAARRRYAIAKKVNPDQVKQMHKKSYKWRVEKYGLDKLAEMSKKYRGVSTP